MILLFFHHVHITHTICNCTPFRYDSIDIILLIAYQYIVLQEHSMTAYHNIIAQYDNIIYIRGMPNIVLFWIDGTDITYSSIQ